MINQVDVISGTPSFISNFVDIPLAKEVLRQVKMYDFGAETFPETLYEKLHQLSPNAVIVNGYGPTEATISCISKVMDGNGKVTIGTPAANVQAYICDLCGNILPAGAKGELVICGAGVGRGYVNLLEKTKEVFITLDGKKAYRSGDLARYNEEGEIEFFGRLDNQVKLRGLRVELDEISSVMNTYPSITHAIVLVKGEGQQQFCSATGRRLVQISTVSIAGDNVNGKFPEEKTLHENELFFGQSLENKYIYTKFLAEQAVLEAVANGALDGKVIRVGNLMSRHSDGEFQINFVTNGFMRMLRGYAAILTAMSSSFMLMADSIFVGNMLGASEFAAVNCCVPIQQIFGRVSELLGLGGSTAISVARGRRESQKANQIFTAVLFLLAAFSLILLLPQVYATSFFGNVLAKDPILRRYRFVLCL